MSSERSTNLNSQHPSSTFVETKRLRIRAWTDADRPAFAEMATNPIMMRYITGGEAMTEQQIDAGLARQAHFMNTVGYCMGAAELKSNNRVVGVIGLQPVDKDPDIDIGWWVQPAEQGQGLATEAALALQHFLKTKNPNARIAASIHPDNVASQTVARRLGLTASAPVPASSIASWRPDIPVLVFREQS